MLAKLKQKAPEYVIEFYLATILPISAQWTALAPKPAIPAPVIAPTMAWVVDTGQPRDEAKRTQVEDPTKEQTIANSNSSGCGSNSCTSISPPLIVSAVEEPECEKKRSEGWCNN